MKKGQYWSQREKDNLVEGVIKHGPTKYALIKKEFLPDWSETEIRLRICRLLKYYNLEEYGERSFATKEEIETEAAANKERAFEERIRGDTKIMVGGIYYNPPSGAGGPDAFYQSFFATKNAAGSSA